MTATVPHLLVIAYPLDGSPARVRSYPSSDWRRAREEAYAARDTGKYARVVMAAPFEVLTPVVAP